MHSHTIEQEQPIKMKQQEQPIKMKQQEQLIKMKQQEQPIKMKQQEQPIKMKQQEQPIELASIADRLINHKYKHSNTPNITPITTKEKHSLLNFVTNNLGIYSFNKRI